MSKETVTELLWSGEGVFSLDRVNMRALFDKLDNTLEKYPRMADNLWVSGVKGLNVSVDRPATEADKAREDIQAVKDMLNDPKGYRVEDVLNVLLGVETRLGRIK